MIVVDVERYNWGWRWLLVNLDTGERVCTGTQTYWAAPSALTVGERVMVAARDWPVTDRTEGA